jgi:hypothetical protein
VGPARHVVRVKMSVGGPAQTPAISLDRLEVLAHDTQRVDRQYFAVDGDEMRAVAEAFVSNGNDLQAQGRPPRSYASI